MKNIVILAMLSLSVSACSTMLPSETKPSKPSECVAAKAAQLVVKNDMSEAKIKQSTQASIVRKVSPNQPVTMDYRMERVTVTVDPVSHKIIQASCG